MKAENTVIIILTGAFLAVIVAFIKTDQARVAAVREGHEMAERCARAESQAAAAPVYSHVERAYSHVPVILVFTGKEMMSDGRTVLQDMLCFTNRNGVFYPAPRPTL